MFKFNKKKKMIDDFDLSNPTEWTLLMKPQLKDHTLFVHIRCIYNKSAIKEQFDPGGIFHFTEFKGFMKEDKFVVETTKKFSAHSLVDIHQGFAKLLEGYVNAGFIKHYDMYPETGDGEPIKPHYFKDQEQEDEGDDLATGMKTLLKLPGGGQMSILRKKAKIINLTPNIKDEEQDDEEIGGS